MELLYLNIFIQFQAPVPRQESRSGENRNYLSCDPCKYLYFL